MIPRYLVCRAGSHTIGVPIGCARETMRPRPVEVLPGVPPFVLGVSIIRGVPVPVVDVAALLGEARQVPLRFLTVETGGRAMALAIGEVLGVRPIPETAGGPLLGAGDGAVVEAVAAADAELLVLLRTSRIVPDDVWSAVAASAG